MKCGNFTGIVEGRLMAGDCKKAVCPTFSASKECSSDFSVGGSNSCSSFQSCGMNGECRGDPTIVLSFGCSGPVRKPIRGLAENGCCVLTLTGFERSLSSVSLCGTGAGRFDLDGRGGSCPKSIACGKSKAILRASPACGGRCVRRFVCSFVER